MTGPGIGPAAAISPNRPAARARPLGARPSAARPSPAGVRLLEDLMGREWSGMKLGLDRFRRLLGRLGHPERQVTAVLVGGTNGKGSTAAALASMFSAAGYRTGFYSSPHLISYRERVRVDGRAIRRGEVAEAMAAIAPALSQIGASFFEAMTALAFVHFARREVDLAVLEVGIGGALDATNAVDPIASVVTSVGLDHTEVLGPTIAHIARDKAGIARAGRPFVIGARGQARQILLEAAERRGARPLIEGIDGWTRIEELSPDSSRFTFACRKPALWFDDFRAEHLEISLPGRHQVHNAACALLALAALVPSFPRAATGVRPGLARLRWPGRLEMVTPWLLIDGAHNPAGARVLADHLRHFHAGRRVVAVVGMVHGKAPRAFARALGDVVDLAVVSEPPSERAVTAARLAAEFRAAGLKSIGERDLTVALARARARAGPGGLVVACGSLYLAGAIYRRFRRRPIEVI